MRSCVSSAAGRKSRRHLAVLAVAAALVASCATSTATQAPSAGSPSPSTPPRGGTLRVVVPGGGSGIAVDASVGLRDQPPMFLDPQLDGYGVKPFSGTPELARCCLARTLFSYNGLSTEHGGAELQPDLAAAMPDVSADGLTWTIRIRPGLHYGPPLQAVEITAPDFIRALQRLYSPTLATPYQYFDDIEGATAYREKKAAAITGIEARDAHTLVIRLVAPAGDLPARLASASAAPLPPDPNHPDAPFGVAQDADTGYGRFLVSSGPYMLEGSEALDFSVPAAGRTAASGIAPGRITLVRNPSWDATRDPLRPAFADRIEIAYVDTVAQAVADLDSGKADLVWPAYGPSPSVPADVFRAFQAAPARGTAHLDVLSLGRSILMNLAVPPFDDIDVRKALNLAVDKQALVDLQGGPVAQAVATHIAPDVYEAGLLRDYDPYRTLGHNGDPAAAKAQMKRATTYDTNGDGRCDVAACQHVPAVTRDPYGPVAAAFAAKAKDLGIDLEVKLLGSDEFFALTGDPTAKVPVTVGMAYSGVSASGFMYGFDGPAAFWVSDGKEYGNTTMVGATAEQLTKWGYRVTKVPNVDARVEACIPLTGAAQARCWAGVDQYLMEYVVPWVPYSQDQYAALTSPRVLAYGFDELVGTTSLDQLALKP